MDQNSKINLASLSCYFCALVDDYEANLTDVFFIFAAQKDRE